MECSGLGLCQVPPLGSQPSALTSWGKAGTESAFGIFRTLELLLSLDWRVLPLISSCCLLLHSKSWPREDKLSKCGLDDCFLICLPVPSLNLPPASVPSPESIFHAKASMFFQRCNFDLDLPALKTLQWLLITFRIKFSPQLECL